MKKARLAVALAVAGVGLMSGPASASIPIVGTQTCPIPVVGVDPDSVTLTAPVLGVATMTASETPAELGPGAPTVKLFAFRSESALPAADLLHGLTGPSSSGAVSFSGPATGHGAVAERVTFSAPGTYRIGFLALFDNGIHPCTSLLPTNHVFTVVVP